MLHPARRLGFRIETGKSSIAYLPDHEPALAGIAARSLDWISGGCTRPMDADLVLHDAQYIEDEYESGSAGDIRASTHAVAFCTRR